MEQIKISKEMKMQKISSPVFQVVLYIQLLTIFVFPSQRSQESLNNDWNFYKGEVINGFEDSIDIAAWERIDLPHTWNAWDSYDQRNIDDGLDLTFAYYRGPCWYRRTISVPMDDKSKRIYLNFEGANTVTDVYVNEFHAGKHIGGYTGFEFDITSFVNFGGDNIIAVRVDNSYNYDIPPQSADYTMYGGIYRDVYLVKTAPVHIKQVLIHTPEVSESEAVVSFNLSVINQSTSAYSGKAFITILDPNNKEVSNMKELIEIPANSSREIMIENKLIENPRLWSVDAPNLYTVRIELTDDLVIDNISEQFGLRWFRFDPDEGFFLNGKHLQLNGVNRHQDRAGFGNALTNEQHLEDMLAIKSVGANFVRLAHYPQDPAVLNACDSLGILVWEEIPVVRSVGKEKFAENAVNMLQEMINHHYNHPSIIIWGLMNEVIRDQREEELHWTVDLCKQLNKLAKQLDPTRYTAQAQFADRGTDILQETDIIGLNKYYGWYSDTFETFGRYLDNQKKLYPEKVFIISEYGAGSKRGYHEENPEAPDFSESWQLDLHQSYWDQITTRKYIAGSAVWGMFDFASNEKGGNIVHINQKGLMSFDRQPKDIFYFYQSKWKEEPMAYIVSHTWHKRSGQKGETKKVEVLSNCEQVELFLNNKSLGKRKYPFVWDVLFEGGANYLKAVGEKETKTVMDEMSLIYFMETPTLTKED